MRNNNKVILDISKCTHAWSGWITTCGNYRRRLKPKQSTVHGQEFDEEAPAMCVENQMNPREKYVTMFDLADENGMLDIWIPYATFQLSNNHSLTYTGDKALSMMAAWKERIFNKGKKERK